MKPPWSVLQSTSWSPAPSGKRMLLTFVPFLSTIDEPLTFRSLMRMTESPSTKMLPLTSRMTPSVSASVPCASSTAGHSKLQSGQTLLMPSWYVFSSPHCRHAGAVRFSDIDVAGTQRIRFNEFTARLNIVAHQHGEDMISFDCIINLYPQ